MTTAASPIVKLLYFNLRARGEPLKMMLLHSGLEWQNQVVTFEEWLGDDGMKHSMPNKQVPVLEILSDGGKLLPESIDIAKWIAERCSPSLIPTTKELQAKAEKLFQLPDVTKDDDIVADGIKYRLGLANPLLNFYSIEKASKLLPGFLQRVPTTYSYLETELEEGPYFCGSDLCYVDFQLFHYIDNVYTLDGGYTLREKPKLEQFYNRMKELDAVEKHLSMRPKCGTKQIGNPKGCIIYEISNPSKDIPTIKEYIASMSSS